MSLASCPSVSYDAQLSPPIHHEMVVRPHTNGRWCVRGDREMEMGRYHESAKAGRQAIVAYCTRLGHSATIKIYSPQAVLYRTDEIKPDGTLTSLPSVH